MDDLLMRTVGSCALPVAQPSIRPSAIKMGKFLRAVGWVWIVAAVAVMLTGYATTWYLQGFSKFIEVLPGLHNVISFVVALLTLAPGIGLVMLGYRIDARRARPHSPD